MNNGRIGTPAAEFPIDEELVSGLLREQHPDLAPLPLERAHEGWDNILFRLGDRMAVRLPRRTTAAPLIIHEQVWLPRLADRLALPVPAPCRVGTPSRSYPWRWSVVPWLKGMAADQNQPHSSQAQAWAAFLRSLHIPAPTNAPINPLRGIPLRQRAAAIEERIQRLASETSLIGEPVKNIWKKAMQAPFDVSPTWLHGDLHPRNVLVEDSVITGVVDWGDITIGDCATDLASIWMLFAEPQARRNALAAYADLSEATLLRAKGWAILFGVILLDTGLVDNPRNATIGERILRRVVEE